MGFGWWRLFGAAVAGILFFHGFCFSEKAPNYTFMHEATSAPNTTYYDYIIIGGGTAGCPLAATLSQNYSVLLLERGGSPYGNNNITNLDAFGQALSDLSPTSPSQRFISEDGVISARARVLGGGSCLNAGFYSRAATDYVKRVGWDGRLANESYQWVEKLVAFQPPMKQWQSAVRDGLVEVGVVPDNGFTYDHLYGTKLRSPSSKLLESLTLEAISKPPVVKTLPAEALTETSECFPLRLVSSLTVPPKQRTPEAIAKAVESMSNLDEAVFRGGFILEKIMGPLSTGHLELRNRNPNENPSVTFNYFKEPEDLQRCVEGIRTIERIIESKSFSKFRYDGMSVQTLLNMTASAPVNLLPKHSNVSTSLEQFCRDTVMTIWHYHGGCQVGMVVDRDYKVLGVDALRVIDGSTFNYSPGTNPQATVMMLGRYMGVRILSERLASDTSN
ncbi:hypothetical protein F0562_013305 [Nyssa sinensis]|uniref:Glucose-methanol-choline oxidoreductase C-terminal domain-containing protein n=1 Tax=Nyssa sinensis TaxID=561372 RepID=A0A5J4ZWR5_9ASTE|nr:hypothetical protein F0562_013305 [Nyssa sinensis]